MNSSGNFCLNASRDTITTEMWTLGSEHNGVVVAVFEILYILLGLPFNVMVLVVILKEHLYHQPTIILLMNLVISDILLICSVLPFEATVGIAGEYIFGYNDYERCVSCLLGIINVSISLVSIFTISMMSLDRFLYIYKPLRYEKIITPLRTLLAVSISWIILLTIILSFYFSIDEIEFVFFPPFLSCAVNPSRDNYFSIILLVMVSLPLISMLICNIWVVCIVLKNINAIYKVRRSKGSDRKSHEDKLNESVRKERHMKQLHLFRVFGGLLLSNVITWLPTIIIFGLRSLIREELSKIPTGGFTFSLILFYFQVFLHPLVEISLLKDVRDPLKKMVFCGCLKLKEKYVVNHDNLTAAGGEEGCGDGCGQHLSCTNHDKDGGFWSVLSKVCVFWNICHAALVPPRDSSTDHDLPQDITSHGNTSDSPHEMELNIELK